ncbi:RNA pseudouridylate synthase [Phytophthora infestans]|nr:RNA pseudouridylate synthase [Phytophthora infestans]
MASTKASWQHHVVTADDLASGPPGRHEQWVQLAARVFPELGTVSKAKRARKVGNLLFNGEPRVPTLTSAGVNDTLAYFSPDKHKQLVASNRANANDCGTQSWLNSCMTQGLRVVYECSILALVVKPVGIHVKGRGKRTVEQALPLLLRKQHVDAGDFELPLPHAVHRLDYRVGGLLLVAKTRKMEVKLSAQFERHSVAKQYRAILVGNVFDKLPASGRNSSVDGSIELPSALLEIRDELQFLDGEIDSKPCLTAMRVVSTTRSARYEWISTVDLWPLTGRKHQLRIHTARHGHPIVGDDLYHDAIRSVGMEKEPAVVRGMGLFLYAVGIAFEDFVGNRRNFRIQEPNKFARFRHFCELNWTKQARKKNAANHTSTE